MQQTAMITMIDNGYILHMQDEAGEFDRYFKRLDEIMMFLEAHDFTPESRADDDDYA